MGWRVIVAFAATVATALACSGSNHPEEGSALMPTGAAGGPSETTELAGTCPDQGDAAACPSLGGEPAWVGCARVTVGTNTAGTKTGAFQSCTCFATETGTGAWACEVADANPTLPEASGPMTGLLVPPPCAACVPPASTDAAPDAPDE